MDPTARANFPAFLIHVGEGWMTKGYLDQAHPPNVTIAAGNLVPNLAAWSALDWRRDADDSPASAAEVQTAWLVVRSHPELAVHGGGAYQSLTHIHATEDSLNALVESHIDTFEGTLRRWWPGWDDAPGPAQEALMRICWAVGPARLDVHWPSYWPRLHAAWCARDWSACAQECRIPALNATEPAANQAEANLFLQAAAAASATAARQT